MECYREMDTLKRREGEAMSDFIQRQQIINRKMENVGVAWNKIIRVIHMMDNANLTRQNK